MKALVCDDDKTIVSIVVLLLKKLGFSVATAENGLDGLALLRGQKPDLLLLDLEMPGLDGLGVLAELQKSGKEGAHVIVLSAHDNPQKREEVRGLGADEMMIKPFSPPVFLRHIQDLLREGKVGRPA